MNRPNLRAGPLLYAAIDWRQHVSQKSQRVKKGPLRPVTAMSAGPAGLTRYYGASATSLLVMPAPRFGAWGARAAAFLKHKLREGDVTYAELAKRLKKHSLAETESSITNKLMRGTFPATFFLACFAALELDGVALDKI